MRDALARDVGGVACSDAKNECAQKFKNRLKRGHVPIHLGPNLTDDELRRATLLRELMAETALTRARFARNPNHCSMLFESLAQGPLQHGHFASSPPEWGDGDAAPCQTRSAG